VLDRPHPDGGCAAVVCARCGVRTTLRSVWSTVDRCPHCLAPLMVASRWLPIRPSSDEDNGGGGARDRSADIAPAVER
jgi:transposase